MTAIAEVAASFPGELQETGLIIRGRLTYDQWATAGLTLSVMHDGVRWWLGDWLRYGEHRYGEKYAHAASETGLSPDALRSYQWVADAVAPERRRRELSWSQHRAVAKLPPEQQVWALELAVRGGWSSRGTEHVVKAADGQTLRQLMRKAASLERETPESPTAAQVVAALDGQTATRVALPAQAGPDGNGEASERPARGELPMMWSVPIEVAHKLAQIVHLLRKHSIGVGYPLLDLVADEEVAAFAAAVRANQVDEEGEGRDMRTATGRSIPERSGDGVSESQ